LVAVEYLFNSGLIMYFGLGGSSLAGLLDGMGIVIARLGDVGIRGLGWLRLISFFRLLAEMVDNTRPVGMI
jgi:hypothetical protein